MPLSSWRAIQARTALGLSRQDLANATGISETTIGRLERGDREPHPGTAEALLAYFDKCGILFVDKPGVIGLPPTDEPTQPDSSSPPHWP